MGYIAVVAEEMGVAVWLIVIMIIWTLVWKLLALWKSARNTQVVWFIVIAIINTVGILPILYIFVFSKLGKQKKIVKRKAKKK